MLAAGAASCPRGRLSSQGGGSQCLHYAVTTFDDAARSSDDQQPKKRRAGPLQSVALLSATSVTAFAVSCLQRMMDLCLHQKVASRLAQRLGPMLPTCSSRPVARARHFRLRHGSPARLHP